MDGTTPATTTSSSTSSSHTHTGSSSRHADHMYNHNHKACSYHDHVVYQGQRGRLTLDDHGFEFQANEEEVTATTSTRGAWDCLVQRQFKKKGQQNMVKWVFLTPNNKEGAGDSRVVVVLEVASPFALNQLLRDVDQRIVNVVQQQQQEKEETNTLPLRQPPPSLLEEAPQLQQQHRGSISCHDSISVLQSPRAQDPSTTSLPLLRTEDFQDEEDPILQGLVVPNSSSNGQAIAVARDGHKNSPPQAEQQQQQQSSSSSAAPAPTAPDFGMDKLSHDTYSFLILTHWATIPFLYAMAVMTLQATVFGVLAGAFLLGNATENNNPLGLPANVAFEVRFTQILAILITVATQADLQIAANLCWSGFHVDLQRAFGQMATRPRWIFSIGVRVLGGALGLFVTLLLIVTAETVIDVLLNFTAMEFVSKLDEVAFFLAHQGFVGQRNQRISKSIMDTTYNSRTSRKALRRTLVLLIILASVLGVWTYITMEQQSGKYLCTTIYVQFDDELLPPLGTFSGLYDRETTGTGLFAGHVKYVERQMGGTGVFSYCDNAWIFSYSNNVDVDDDHDNNSSSDNDDEDRCENWNAKSSESISFDLTSTATTEWFARDEKNGRSMPMQHFRMVCMDCDGSDDDFCGDFGACHVDTNACHCQDGYYGLRCEFEMPCAKLTTDERFEGLVSSRDWSSTYELLKEDANHNDTFIEVYHRPVWGNEYEPGLYDLIFYTGRRWAITHSGLLFTASDDSGKDVFTFLQNFHGHYSDYQVAFMSQSMDFDTPLDAATPLGLRFFSPTAPDPSSNSIQSADETQPSTAVFICSVCNNETNPCSYNGVCVDGNCECSIGSKGALCEVIPTSNGACDPYFNSPEFKWDGGDCCESTCVSTDENTCGKVAGNPYADAGYFFCHEPDKTWLPNSQPVVSISGRNAESGISVALPTNNMLAVGERNGLLVRVFDKDGSEWVPRGRPLEGPAKSGFGERIAMAVNRQVASNPPATLLVGASRLGTVSLYDCTEQVCEQTQDILGGPVFALSHGASTVAIQTKNGTKNLVDVLDRTVDGFVKVRPSIPPLEMGRQLAATTFTVHGIYLSVSRSGDNIAVGSLDVEYVVDAAVSAALTVQVYAWDKQAESWRPLGSSLFFEDHLYSMTVDSRRKVSGIPVQSVVLSGGNGDVLAVGSNLPSPGVQVYVLNGTDWEKRGPVLVGDNAEGVFGYSVDLSGDASILAVGTDGEDSTVYTFQWDGTTYEQLWNSIPGGSSPSVSLASDGAALAVGLPFDNGGITEVYAFTSKCPNGSSLVRVSLTTDGNGGVSWSMRTPSGQTIMEGGGPNAKAAAFTRFVDEICYNLQVECAIFTIFDDDGGIEPPAGYSIFVDGEEVVHGDTFDSYYQQHQLGSSCTVCPEGQSRLKIELQAQTVSPKESAAWSLDYSNRTEILTWSQAGPAVASYCIPTLSDCAIFSLANTGTQGKTTWCTTLPGYPVWQYTIFLDDENVAGGSGEYSCNQRSVIGECTSLNSEPITCDKPLVPLTVSVSSERSPSQVTWSILDCSENVLLEGGPYRPTDFGLAFVEEMCVAEDGCFIFAIQRGRQGDFGYSYGSFNVSLAGEVVASGDEFNDSEDTAMGIIDRDVQKIPVGNCAAAKQQDPQRPQQEQQSDPQQRPPQSSTSPQDAFQLYCK